MTHQRILKKHRIFIKNILIIETFAQFLQFKQKKQIMKEALLVFTLLLSILSAHAQVDSLNTYQNAQIRPLNDVSEPSLTIYPVPVRDNVINIRSTKEISSIKITNIIGQDIYRANYNNPQIIIKITLDNPARGMYLVAITFSDRTRIVKKIMIEGAI